MGQNAMSGIAALVALAFLVMALTACASAPERAEAGPAQIAAVEGAPAVPEFHGAHIGGDALRDRLRSE